LAAPSGAPLLLLRRPSQSRPARPPGTVLARTANGETFNTNALTAAHKTLPFGTQVRVKNERTGKSVVVRINDRGPYAYGRVIDLSKAAAEAVGISGVGQVTLAAL
jgi:rare lipoprotein A